MTSLSCGGLFDENVFWHGGGTSEMWAEGVHGRDAVFEQFGKIEAAGSFKRDLKHVLADDDHAIALVHNDIHKCDTHMQWYEAMVFHLNADGRIPSSGAFTRMPMQSTDSGLSRHRRSAVVPGLPGALPAPADIAGANARRLSRTA